VAEFKPELAWKVMAALAWKVMAALAWRWYG